MMEKNQQTASRYNHKYRKLSDSIGLSEQRVEELKDIIVKSKCKTRSETFEKILAHGLSVIEVAYVFYSLGRVDERTSTNPIAHAIASHIGKIMGGQEGGDRDE